MVGSFIQTVNVFIIIEGTEVTKLTVFSQTVHKITGTPPTQNKKTKIMRQETWT